LKDDPAKPPADRFLLKYSPLGLNAMAEKTVALSLLYDSVSYIFCDQFCSADQWLLALSDLS
jgi:hypothetical protein